MKIKKMVRTDFELIGWDVDGRAYILNLNSIELREGWQKAESFDFPDDGPPREELLADLEAARKKVATLEAKVSDLEDEHEDDFEKDWLDSLDGESRHRLDLLDRLLTLESDRVSLPTEQARQYAAREYESLVQDERARRSIH